MAVKRLLGMVVPVVFLASGLLAQVNEVSATAGRTFVSTQTLLNSGLSFNPTLHFANEETVAFNYGRLLTIKKGIGIRAELPVAIYFRMDLNTAYYGVPKDIGALFATPSLRLNFFTRDSLTPWVSAGGGYGRFRYAPGLNFYGTNEGPGGGNTGVMQFGAGLDAWIFHNWGARLEARDFYSGKPDLNGLTSANISTNVSRQHNYYVGAGVMYRF